MDKQSVAGPSRPDYWEVLAEMERQRGRRLTQREIEDFTTAFYAPQYREDLARISPAAWDEYHAELERENGLRGV